MTDRVVGFSRVRDHLSAALVVIGNEILSGKVVDTNTNDAANGELVRSSTRPRRATSANQSPRNDTTWAKKRSRRSRFRRRRSTIGSR